MPEKEYIKGNYTWDFSEQTSSWIRKGNFWFRGVMTKEDTKYNAYIEGMHDNEKERFMGAQRVANRYSFDNPDVARAWVEENLRSLE